MILDTLSRAGRYAGLHRRFERAFRFLAETDLESLPAGRSDIDGDEMFVILDRKDGRGRDGSRLEAHRRYIDIQYTVRGHEEIGWAPLAQCVDPDAGFDSEKDIIFFRDPPSAWLRVPPGTLAIFFPDDAHAPLAGSGALTKAIVKIAVTAQ
jgi:YhcH/YjgK/YiaL family protein